MKNSSTCCSRASRRRKQYYHVKDSEYKKNKRRHRDDRSMEEEEKKRRRREMIEIPNDDILEEIMVRVPVRTLIACQTVSKHWRSTITLRFFRERYKLHHQKIKEPKFLCITKRDTLCSLSINLHNGRPPCAEVTGELSLNQVMIDLVFHCDGLLLCTIRENSRSIVVWNPCTGQTKWIQVAAERRSGQTFVLGSYQDNKSSSNKSYKILRYLDLGCRHQEFFDIYDIKSDSWRNLDVTPPIRGHMCLESRVSMKGKTYWFVLPRNEYKFPAGLISFDYSTERFERLPLPYKCTNSGIYSLSPVGEEKLSCYLQHKYSSRCEVWITNKIDDETKEMSWSKLFEVQVTKIRRDIWRDISFLVDEEKKIVVCCEAGGNLLDPVIKVSVAGALSNAKRGYFPVKTMPLCYPFTIVYVPSLAQIQ